MSKKCKHLNARLEVYKGGFRDENFIHVKCPDCSLVWMGYSRPWVTMQGNIRKPPRWVKRILRVIS